MNAPKNAKSNIPKSVITNHRPNNYKLLILCGIVGIIGCIGVLVTNIIGTIVVDGYNPISQTISALAITEKAWIQDSGLDMFAVSFITCAVGLITLRRGDVKWKSGLFMLLLLAVDIFLIAEHNKYAGREGVGAAIHIYCVYALGVLFTLAPLLLAFGLRLVNQGWYRFSLGCAISWAVLSPFFFFTPEAWNGLYERFLAIIMIAWVAGISWLLIKIGRGKTRISNVKPRYQDL